VAKIPIRIDVNGAPVPQFQNVNPKDKVYWVSDDANQTWFISFDSPALEHFFANDNGNGETKKITMRKKKGTYNYLVSSSNDPTLSTKGKAGIFSGGGIIVDA
jgi:hypothetical protein